MSNYYPAAITKDGLKYNSSEAYYQTMKFTGNPEAQAIIRGQKNPSMAAFFGRSSNMTRRADWDLVKDSVMEEAVQLKFDQHPQLKEQLLATSDWKLVEKTNDSYWGNGKNGNGLN